MNSDDGDVLVASGCIVIVMVLIILFIEGYIA
jgi:hypothetical protein